MNSEIKTETKQLPPGKDQAANPALLIGRELLRELSMLSPWLSAGHIIAEWTLIVAAAWLCNRFWSLPLYLAAVVWIGSRQHALMILMHEGVHYRLFRSRMMNDWVSEVALAWPVLVSARAYRRNHFAHHKYLNTVLDPDWARRQGDPAWIFPKCRRDLLLLMLRSLSGLGAIGLVRLIGRLLSKDTGVTGRFIILRYCFYLAAFTTAVWMSAERLIVMYWLVPLFTWLIFIFHLRSIAEHSLIPRRSYAYSQTRTTVPSVLERLLVAPKNVSYHLEHHLYPSVPFYRLPKLHQILTNKVEFRDAHITRTYLGVLKECIIPSAAGDVDSSLAHSRFNQQGGGVIAMNS
jgi:fatty acid desaturase